MTIVVPAVTWLPVDPGTELLSLLPAGLAHLEALYAGVWGGGIDPVTLELCRVRIATLVGDAHGATARDPRAVASCGDAEALDAILDELPSWPRSPRVADAQRAALGFAEQFVIDPHGFSDEAAARMHVHFDEPGLTTLTMAVAVFDALSRVRRFLTVDGPSAAGSTDARLAVVPA
jgi:alkylhydroperoxidase family enzyme